MTTTAAPSLVRRVVRSSAITTVGFVASQAIRLGANLVLTRLLFPEAFGMMALIAVFLVALSMLSDVGLGTSIMQSRRGDDPDFLDTAWTIQIIRGAILFIVALAATPALARFYGEPELTAYLPVAALSLLVTGLRPTRLDTAYRHLRAGIITILDLAAQVAGLLIGVILAWIYQTVWALVATHVLTSAVHVALVYAVLPGHRNRLRLDRSSASELIHFGKYIFLATVCGFLSEQADKVILGRYLDLREFGLYNMAFFLASVPYMLASMVRGRVLIPVYRDSPPAESAENWARVRRLRAGAFAALFFLMACFVVGGDWLVRLLYDSRYYDAAPLVALIAVAQAPSLLILSCDAAPLAMGDSRRFLVLTVARAILVPGGLLLGFELGGLPGAILGQGLGNLAAYPVLAWLLRPYRAWDPWLDVQFLGASAVLGALALWLN